MDDEQFDRWTRALEGRRSRRGLTGVAAGALAALGLAAAEAKKKKKKKKKGKKRQSPPSPPSSPPTAQCVELDEECTIGQDTCCLLPASFTATAPICNFIAPDIDDDTECCLPSGTVTASNPGGILRGVGCCRLGWKENTPGEFGGPGTCCARNGIRPENDDETLCCDYQNTTAGGLCCIPSGQPCIKFVDLCCDGTECSGSNVCP